MKRVVRLTESQLYRLIKETLSEAMVSEARQWKSMRTIPSFHGAFSTTDAPYVNNPKITAYVASLAQEAQQSSDTVDDNGTHGKENNTRTNRKKKSENKKS